MAPPSGRSNRKMWSTRPASDKSSRQSLGGAGMRSPVGSPAGLSGQRKHDTRLSETGESGPSGSRKRGEKDYSKVGSRSWTMSYPVLPHLLPGKPLAARHGELAFTRA